MEGLRFQAALLRTRLLTSSAKSLDKLLRGQVTNCSQRYVDVVSSSPSKADENEFVKLKKKFTELSSNNMEAVILHVDLAIAEELVSEIPNYQIDQV